MNNKHYRLDRYMLINQDEEEQEILTLEVKPQTKTVKVTKKGEGMQAEYHVVPLE